MAYPGSTLAQAFQIANVRYADFGHLEPCILLNFKGGPRDFAWSYYLCATCSIPPDDLSSAESDSVSRGVRFGRTLHDSVLALAAPNTQAVDRQNTWLTMIPLTKDCVGREIVQGVQPNTAKDRCFVRTCQGTGASGTPWGVMVALAGAVGLAVWMMR